MRSLDLTSLAAAYADNALTPTSLVEEILERIDRHGDPAVWIYRLTAAELRAYARDVEARGPASQPLYGIPFAIKDNIDLAGAPTTAACPDFAYIAETSAPVVERLIAAGAIPVGKTNLDQFATGLVGVRSPYGTPRNPFHPQMIPGGSSSGSAVAVAAGLVTFALGTDTAGSGRVPAGLNNIVGLKPTRGALSSRGVVPACRSLDCVSIFALTCEDATEVQRVAESFDPEDPFSRQRSIDASRWREERPVNGSAGALRIGVPPPDQLDFFGDDEARRRFADELARLRTLGTTPVEIDFTPFSETAALLYQGPWVAERWAALREFHREHANAFLPVTRSIVETATNLTAADAFTGMYRLAALARRAAAEWQKMDVLLVPTAPRPYTLAQIEAQPIRHNSELGKYTNFVNLLDLSAVAVPAGFRQDTVPWGVTFIAPAWQEPMLLALGAAWHHSVGGRLGATAVSLDEIRPRRPLARNGAHSESETPVRLAVVGAHLSGLPLNSQLTELEGKLVWSGRTAPTYRLHALRGTMPAKPGLKRVAANGAAIAVEVWELSAECFGRFVAAVPPPMCIGTIALETGESVKGFLCEPSALDDAEDITHFGGWRAYLARK